MKESGSKLIWILLGAVLFNLVFWNEKMGINTAFYDAFIIGAILFLYPEARRSSTTRWLLAGHLVCLAMVIVHNTPLSAIGYIITLISFVITAHFQHRSLFFAAGSFAENGLFLIPSLFTQSWTGSNAGSKSSGKRRIIRFIIFPMILAIAFYLLYANSNSVFQKLGSFFTDGLERFFTAIFDVFSFGRMMFLVLGIFLTGFLLLRNPNRYFKKLEEGFKDDLQREHISLAGRKLRFDFSIMSIFMGRMLQSILSLKYLHRMGVISLILLNFLLLFLNAIDISHLWLGYAHVKDQNLYAMIHEGTDTLIFSIALAIIVLLIFFQGNLNFYQKNSWLKKLAYLWIAQNALLCISVFLRDYYYILESGLAYKRIGVLFFLALVFVGLTTMFWKIYKKKSTFYLLRVNAFSVITLLVLATTVDWDYVIAKHNFSKANEMTLPVDFMATLEGRALPLLDQNRALLQAHQQKMAVNGQWRYNCTDCFLKEIDRRKEMFLRDMDGTSWLSWNLTDATVSKQLAK